MGINCIQFFFAFPDPRTVLFLYDIAMIINLPMVRRGGFVTGNQKLGVIQHPKTPLGMKVGPQSKAQALKSDSSVPESWLYFLGTRWSWKSK